MKDSYNLKIIVVKLLDLAINEVLRYRVVAKSIELLRIVQFLLS